jgi:phosphopantothenoylcysteine decarboxylase/phosphopantothenate--cysteine ligase
MPLGMVMLPFTSTQELKAHTENTLRCNPSSTLFMAAAVSDFIPEQIITGKLKKTTLGESWDLSLIQNIDILSSIDKKGHFIVGFKAESDLMNGKNHAKDMLSRKGLDAVCFNTISDEHSPFGSSSNAITLITHDNETTFPLQKKLPLALHILRELSLS